MKNRGFLNSMAAGSAALLAIFSLGTPSREARAENVAALSAKVDNLVATNQKNYQDVAQAMNSMTEIQQEFRQIKGQLDSSQYIMKESDRVYQDLDLRVSALEDKIGQMHNLLKDISQKMGAPPAVAAPSAAVNPNEVQEFQSLLNVANARDYRNAASGFMGYLKKYPKSENAGSAQYWVGECFYSMGDYAKAISEFQILSEKYPQHPRVKEGVYKQGMSFMKLNKNAEAKLFFQKVIATYPNSAEAFQAKGRLARLEDLEKSNPTLALGPRSDPKATPAPVPTGVPVYKPIMKPNPMPRAPLPPPPGTTGNPTSPTAPSTPSQPAPSSPETPTTQDSGAPLF
ncbi:MAG: tol-pal system protein YbgF [Deltaproteobacteria bacterium]|nr:tol-pal system protein YbgF [Deltaproteobacteria bacterium]